MSIENYALVAQLDRAFGYEPKGRGFESRRARQKKALAIASAFFNEAHLRCMQNEAGLRPMKRAFGK